MYLGPFTTQQTHIIFSVYAAFYIINQIEFHKINIEIIPKI